MIPQFFKLVPGFSEYLITEYGKVWSKKVNRFLKPSNPNHYLTVSLGKEEKKLRVHRLVATVWLPNPDNLPVVHHKDSDRLNNHYSNLEWCTYSHNNRRLSDEDVAEIKRMYATGLYSQYEIANRFRVDQSTICLVIRK